MNPEVFSEVQRLELKLLLEAIYERHGYDFRNYAKASLERRVRRAMAVLDCPTLSSLQDKVLHEEGILPKLVRLLTVQVSDFFRDPEYYQVLRSKVVPVLRTYPSLRFWVAGCSTGEEVYSLAILLREEGLEDIATIFATDIDASAIRMAKDGVYAIDRIATFSENYRRAGGPASLSDYYTAGYGAARFDRSLLKRVVFANHSLATDHVFSEVQLVSCRNVMIYFNPTLQARALSLFREALCRRGFLGLGSKESVAYHHREEFREFDLSSRWYQRC